MSNLLVASALALISLVNNVDVKDINDISHINELYCMSANNFHEAGNQSFFGKVVVSQVVMNRVFRSDYPSTPCDVVLQGKVLESWKTKGKKIPEIDRKYYMKKWGCQFTWFCDGRNDDIPLIKNNEIDRIESRSWTHSVLAAQLVIKGKSIDITEGATHYFSPSVLKKQKRPWPKWARVFKYIKTVEGHRLYLKP